MIQTRQDRERACGWRRPKGFYAVAAAETLQECGKLPAPIGVCPTCGEGVRPTRGWTWIDVKLIGVEPQPCDRPGCEGCPLSRSLPRAGLLWVGECFYRRPQDFLSEAITQGLGISRRLPRIPVGFQVGTTWILLAHRRAFQYPNGQFGHGAFFLFRPTALEYVVDGTESEAFLAKLVEHGVQPVRVEKAE